MRSCPRGSASLACGLAFSLIALLGCGGAADSLPRQAISGTVTLDGKPLEAGSITFDPADPGQPDSVSGFAPIVEGSYSIPTASGLTPGSYRVSIMSSSEDAAPPPTEAPGAPPKKPRKGPIPAKYNTNSTLKAEVKASGTGPLDFALTSK